MTHNPANYLQNYQNYYQSAQEQYEDYYEDQEEDLKENYDDVPADLQAPNSRLYTEGYPDLNEVYARDTHFTETQQQVENNTNMQFRYEYNVSPSNFRYNVPQPQHHHRSRVPKTQPTPHQSTSSYRYSLPHSLYPSCPLANSHSLQRQVLKPDGCNYIPKLGATNLQGVGKTVPQNAGISSLEGVGENYNMQQEYNDQLHTYGTLKPEENNYIPKASNIQAVGRNIPKTSGVNTFQGVEEDFNMQEYQDHQDKYEDSKQRRVYHNQENYEDFEPNQAPAYHCRENYEDYSADTGGGYMADYGLNQEMFVDYKGKRYRFYGNRMAKSGVLKKYPVTVKTPKYISKSTVVPPIHKGPSALCLPVATQPDPGLVKRKSKTNHHLKRTYDQSEPLPPNPNDATENYSYSAHQMHSEGDMNQKSPLEDLENLLDHFENTVVSNENRDTRDGEIRGGAKGNKIKEISKFLKPRVPSSIKAKQEKIAKMKSSFNMWGAPLQPKMKVSLDKLLNRLQKCELSESGEKLSEKSFPSNQRDDEEVKSNKGKNIEHSSFNYETLSRKISPRADDPENESKSLLNKPSTSLTTSLDNKRSSRLIRPLDDNCAIDLHRSKSYIVDLIDRALSKELGTVPRGQQSTKIDMTPKRAVTTISRHRQSCHNELCYEVTAALTDSFISNATAPKKQDVDPGLKLSQSDDCDSKKLCTSFSDDGSYIKQLKQLRWGHIRHIQHEARKLADLEEFLEKCGEVEF